MRVCQVPCLRPDRSSTSSCFCNAHRRSEAEVGGPRDTILSIRMSMRPQQAVLDFRLNFFHHSSSTMQLQRDLYQQSPICRHGPAQRAMTPVKSFFGGYSFLPCTWGIQEAPQEKHGIPLCPPCLRRPSVVCVAGMHTRPTTDGSLTSAVSGWASTRTCLLPGLEPFLLAVPIRNVELEVGGQPSASLSLLLGLFVSLEDLQPCHRLCRQEIGGA